MSKYYKNPEHTLHILDYAFTLTEKDDRLVGECELDNGFLISIKSTASFTDPAVDFFKEDAYQAFDFKVKKLDKLFKSPVFGDCDFTQYVDFAEMSGDSSVSPSEVLTILRFLKRCSE
jgi:hypothetical protein